MREVMPYARDPISEVWDAAAPAVLRRAVSARGRWVSSRIADWSETQRAELLGLWGIDVAGPDDVPSGAARSRWARGFVRAVYAANRKAARPRSIEIHVGRRMPALGVIPAGRAFRIRTHPGGKKARQYAERKAAGRDGDRTPGYLPPDRRDWE